MIAQMYHDQYPLRRVPFDSEHLFGFLAALLGFSMMNSASLHAAPALHNVAAANINVVQNDTSNNVVSVTVTFPLSINSLGIRSGSSRGDFNLQVGDDPSDDVRNGVLITSISQNGRDNGETNGVTYSASAIDAVSGGTVTNGYWVVVQDCTSNRGEFNANCAAAYFPYSSWIGGWARNSGATNGGPNNLLTGSASLALGTHFVDNGSGRSTVDLRSLGIDSTKDGVLLVTHGKNEGNFCLSQVNTNGTWSVFVKDNFGNGTSYEQDPVAFVFVPRTNTTVVSGRFQGDGALLLNSGTTPAFAVANTAVGKWRLTIPGYTPTNGVLIVSAEGGLAANNDNVVSYQADGDSWIIESRDITADAAQPVPVLETPANEPVASFVFIPAEAPVIKPAGPGHNVGAIDIEVVQNDTGNTADSVTLTNRVSINGVGMRPGSSRGDFNLQIGDDPSDDVPNGVLITSITQNGRDNGEATGLNYMAAAMDAVSGGTISNGYWVVVQDCTANRAEYNANCAAAYFPYSTWIGGWARNSTAANGGPNDLFTGSAGIVLGTHFAGLGGGRSTVDLRPFGITSGTDGVLLVTHGKNEGNFCLSQVNTNGTWSVFVKDNFGNGTSYEQDPVAFVFIPRSNNSVISGRFQGDGTILVHNGPAPAFAITNSATGTWRLTIPGQSPSKGVLILSSEGGLSVNNDNVVSYQADGDGWIIESRDITADAAQPLPVLETPLNEPVASFVFIPAEALPVNNEPPGVIAAPSVPLTVKEGATTSYTVRLATQPTASVVISPASSNPNEGTLSPTAITFTQANWNTPQTVTLTGQDDFVADGNVSYFVTNRVTSTDARYAALVVAKLGATTVDNEASLSLSSKAAFYAPGQPAVGLDGRATIYEPDSANYAGGSLTLAFTANGASDDRLEIRNEGSAAGQIGVSGSNVSFGGTVIGTFAGGIGTAPLAVTLNAASTPEATQALLRAVTYRNMATTPSLTPRTVTATLADGVGGTSTATRTIRVTGIRLSEFQEGTDHGYGVYRGAADIALSEAGPDTAWPIGRTPPPAEGLLIDWPDGGVPNSSQVLLRFDNIVGNGSGQIPAGAVVVSAALLIKPLNPGDGGTMHRMLIPWDATNATWNSVGGGIKQDDVQSRTAYDSQIGVVDGSGATGSGFAVSIGVTPDVQAWVSGQTNYGWVVTGWPFNTDGTGIAPSEVAELDDRPQLRVLWVPAGTASPTFRQGANSYNSAFDTRIREPEPDAEASALAGIFVDGGVTTSTDQDHVLIRFDQIIGTGPNQIPPNARVHAAMLDLASVIGNAMGDGGQFFVMLKPWQDTTSTWNTWVNGIQADGVEAAKTPTVEAGVPRLEPNVQGAFNSFEVTADVQAWADGTRQNYGWAILPWTGGTDGWGFATSEAAEERDRPRLRVYYTTGAPQPAGPITLQSPSRSGTVVQIRFTASAGNYSIRRAETVPGPWSEVGTVTVGSDGIGIFSDNTAPASAAFYRVASR